ncbi:MAG: hypothetical protein L3J43_10550 [Sulfurovum sp.]|nr:hypothetical protein [Sulfurovum sp.]
MFQNFRRVIRKMFREFLVYHHSSVEYRAKIFTLMISANGEMCECEKQKLKEIAYNIYKDDEDRAELLLDTVYEYHEKIITKNGLDFEHLIALVMQETKEMKRFAQKIDIGLLKQLMECTDEESEEELLFQERIIEFLGTLKNDYGAK